VGLIDESAMKAKAIYRENPFFWIIKRPRFWAEVIIMGIMPYPMNDPDSFFGLKLIYIKCVNWVDSSLDGFPPGSHIYETPYHTNDFFLAAMFLRYFFIF